MSGYLRTEWENAAHGDLTDLSFAHELPQVLLPDLPQQENSVDCGYFILYQILQSLQLAPDTLRALTKASAEELAQFPWPAQSHVASRKAKLREAAAALFAAARKEKTGDVERLLAEDPVLRQRVQTALWEGPEFSESVKKWLTARPRDQFSLADLDQMTSKQLRALCVQCGVLPSGMLERPLLLRALAPLSTDRQPQEKPRMAERFSIADLEKMSAKQLRTLCVQRAVLPGGMVEKQDLLRVLIPFSTDRQGSKASRDSAPKAAPPAKAAAKPAAAFGEFSTEELKDMPINRLKSLCMHHGVLPPAASERADFVKALLPKAKGYVRPPSELPSLQVKPNNGQPPPVAAPLSQVLNTGAGNGAAKTGGYTKETLKAMTTKQLRTLCVHHACLPNGSVERCELEEKLLKIAAVTEENPPKRRRASAWDVQK